jgi:hypothetical protein
MPGFRQLAGKLFAYTDGTYDRVQVGHLDAYSAGGWLSPAQDGIRILDAGGNPVFDSTGMTAMLRAKGNITLAIPVAVSNTAFADIPGLNLTVTLQRRGRIWISACMYGSSAGASGQRSFVEAAIDGQRFSLNSSNRLVWDKATTAWTNGSISTGNNGPFEPGDHVVSLQSLCDSGQTLTLQVASIEVYVGEAV